MFVLSFFEQDLATASVMYIGVWDRAKYEFFFSCSAGVSGHLLRRRLYKVVILSLVVDVTSSCFIRKFSDISLAPCHF